MRQLDKMGTVFMLMGLNLGVMLGGVMMLPAQASEAKVWENRSQDRRNLTQGDPWQALPAVPPPLPNLPNPPSLSLPTPAPNLPALPPPLPNLPSPPSLSLPSLRCVRQLRIGSSSVFNSRFGTFGDLAVEYALLGIPDQPAQIVLNSQLYPETKILTLLAIADAYLEIGQPTLVSQTLSQALLVVSQLESVSVDIGGTQAAYLSEIAKKFVQIGNLDQALQIVQTHSNEYYQDEILVEIAIALAEIGKFDQAIEVVETLKDQNFNKGDAFLGIAQQYIKAGDANQAFEMIQKLNYHCTKALTLNDFVKQLIEAKNTSLALQVAESIEDEGVKTEALIEVASGYLAAGQTTQAISLLSQALELLETDTSSINHLERSITIAGLLRKAGQPQQATEILSQAWETYQKSKSSEATTPLFSFPQLR